MTPSERCRTSLFNAGDTIGRCRTSLFNAGDTTGRCTTIFSIRLKAQNSADEPIHLLFLFTSCIKSKEVFVLNCAWVDWWRMHVTMLIAMCPLLVSDGNPRVDLKPTRSSYESIQFANKKVNAKTWQNGEQCFYFHVF